MFHRTSSFALTAPYFALTYNAELQARIFNPIPLGKVLPSRWLKDQLNVKVNGLAGNEMEVYSFDWIGGSSFYFDLEEAGSYWFNGLVPTGVLSGSVAIKNQTSNFLDYVLAQQQSDGWIGPETGDKPKYLWGRYLFLLGTIQMVESDPSLADMVIPALYKFVSLSNTMLQQNEGLEEWGQARWQEYLISLQWLYENYPEDNEDLLVDTMNRIRATGLDWNSVFNPANFPTITVDIETHHPFSDMLTVVIDAAQPFTYKVRIPGWTVNGNITINGGSARSLNPDNNGLHSVNIDAGKTTLSLNVPAEVTIENRNDGAVAPHRGPQHYAFDIPRSQTRSQTVLSTNSQQSNAKDFQFDATDAWNYAIDPSTAIFSSTDGDGDLPSPNFDSSIPPFSIT